LRYIYNKNFKLVSRTVFEIFTKKYEMNWPNLAPPSG